MPSQRSLHRRWLEAIGSFPLLAVGVAMLLRSDLGGAPFDAFNTGVMATLGVPLFVGFLIVATISIVVGRALGGAVGPLTFLVLAVLGVLIDAVYSNLPTLEAVPGRASMFGVGMILAVAGVALQVNADVGPGPGEVLMLGLVNQGLSVRAAKWTLDAAVLAVGVALGGVVGIGTAVMMIGFAPLLARALRLLGYVPPRAVGALEAVAPVTMSAPVAPAITEPVAASTALPTLTVMPSVCD